MGEPGMERAAPPVIDPNATMEKDIMKSLLTAAVALTLFTQIPALAQAATAKPTISAEQKKAKSKECSAQADAKGLHGHARKTFRSKCKRGDAT